MSETRQPLLVLSDQERATLQAMMQQRDLPARVRERLEMVKAADLGHDLATIARWSGRTLETVRRWLAQLSVAGLEGLGDAPRAGRPRKADTAYVAALEATVETTPRALGLPFDVWTSVRLSTYLCEQTGVAVSPGWLRTLLMRQRFACGRPKHTLTHLQDAEEVARCEAELAQVGEKGGGCA